MKTIFTFFIAGFILSSFTLFAGIGEVINAVKSGNASQVEKFFDATIDISVAGKSATYSKSQGEMVLKDFFNNNPVTGFTIIHQGDNSGSEYCIGTLATKAGNYRTTIYMKKKGSNQVLQEIRFEK